MRFFQHPFFLNVIRWGVGGVFLLFGVSKALEPFSGMEATVAQYQMLPSSAVPMVAAVFLVAEVAVGLMLVLGVFTKQAAQVTTMMLVVYIIVIAQAMLRGIPIPDCGCSAAAIQLGKTPTDVLIRDGIMLVGMLWLVWQLRVRSLLPWSVDARLSSRA